MVSHMGSEPQWIPVTKEKITSTALNLNVQYKIMHSAPVLNWYMTSKSLPSSTSSRTSSWAPVLRKAPEGPLSATEEHQQHLPSQSLANRYGRRSRLHRGHSCMSEVMLQSPSTSAPPSLSHALPSQGFSFKADPNIVRDYNLFNCI